MSNGVLNHARIRLLAGGSLLAMAWAMPATADITTSGDGFPFPLGPGNTDITGQSISVGGTNPGFLTVSGGSILTADRLSLSPGAGVGGLTALGQVVVDGSGSTINLVSNFVPLSIGGWGTGIMSVTGGGFVSAGAGGCGPGTCQIFMGGNSGASGSLTISGAGSRVDANGSVFAGFVNFNDPIGTPGGHTTATLSLASGGVLNVAGSLDLANSFGRTAVGALGTETVNTTATVNGSGSQINVTSSGFASLSVGSGGGATGSLAISNGGDVTVTSTGSNASLTIGGNGTTPGGHGTVTVDGLGSSLSVQGFSGSSMAIGDSTGASGSLTVSNGATVTSGSQTTGINGGSGSITVNSGGVLTTGPGNFGRETGSTGALTVSGANSTFTSTGFTAIGGGGNATQNGQGTVTVNSGGLATFGSASFGTGGSGVGTATVDGAGSELRFTTGLAIGSSVASGQATSGTIDVTNGGKLSVTGANGFTLGFNSGNSGTLNISGAQSEATVANFSSIGQNGTGSIAIDQGGKFSGNGAHIGNNAGGNGIVTVDGAGSQFNLSGFLNLGQNSAGSLTLSNGATSSLASGMAVGNNNGGNGILLVQSGADVTITGTTAGATIGNIAGSTGTATVAGIGSTWTIANGLTVGNNGTGTLNINAGASVIQQGLGGGTTQIGGNATGQGTLNINGGSMTVLNAELGNPPGERHAFMGVGRDGTGTVNITNGGHLTIGEATSGTQAGSTFGAGLQLGGSQGGTPPTFATGVHGTGTVKVDGAGSTLDLLGKGSFINIGRFGNTSQGTMEVTNGAVVSGMQVVNVARGATSGSPAVVTPGFGANGSLLVSGAGAQLNVNGLGTTNAGATLNIGAHDAIGTATVSNGGAVNVTSAAGATSAAGLFLAGGHVNGDGTLNIASGGTVNVSNALPGLVGPVVAVGQTGTGLLSMNGGNLNVTGTDAVVFIGRTAGSTGTATFLNGATVAADVIVVGSEAGAVGSMTVSGVSTVVNLTGDSLGTATTGGGLAIGRGGVGSATIAGGATVNINATDGGGGLAVGGTATAAGGTGSLIVTGAGTSVMGSGGATLTLGRADPIPALASAGSMTISAGAVVNLGAGGTASIGHTAGSTGTLTVTGSGSVLNAGSFLGIGQSLADAAGGIGIMNVTNGGQVIATTLHNGATGIITGTGTITATTFINDGIINPGNSPGTLRIHAADFQNNGTIVLEILENPDGTYSVDNLIFDDGFVPELNNIQFAFLGDTDAAAAAASGLLNIDNFLKAEDTLLGVVSLSLALTNEAPPPSGPSLLSLLQAELTTTTFAATSETGNQVIDLTNYNPSTGGGAEVTGVPEPESLALLAPGLLGLYWLRRRRAA